MSKQPSNPARRGFFLGAASAGAVAAGATVLPVVSSQLDSGKSAAAKPTKGGGVYSPSAHIKRYYETTQV
jgi:hypothetical protein